jgi:WD40 repeat protein
MVRSIQAHGEWAFTVQPHKSGSFLATAGGDNLVKLWSWPQLEEIGRFTGHEDDVHAIGFTPDGSRLVSVGDDLTVRVWDVATRRQLLVLEGHEDTIPGLAISPDGSLAATASRDGTVRLWSLTRGECVGVLRGHTDDVMSVAFHPGGRELASASYDGTVRLWECGPTDLPQSPRPMVGVLNGHDDWVFSVAYSPGGEELVTAAGDGVRTFDRQSGRLLWKTSSQRNVSHALWLSAARVATTSADASIAFWRAGTGEQTATLWTRFTPDVTEGRKLVAE